MKRWSVFLSAALLIVGITFGEASAVRFDFTGKVSPNASYLVGENVTGYFEYNESLSEPGTGEKIYKNTEGSAMSLTFSGGHSATFTGIDVVIHDASGNSGYDSFMVTTDQSPLFSLEFQNKINFNNITLNNLLSSTALPDELADFNFLTGDPTITYSMYSQLFGTYELDGNQIGFEITALSVPDASILLLLGPGLVGLGIFGRRKVFRK